MTVIKRSLMFSLKNSNSGKLELIDMLWEEYELALVHFLDWGWDNKKLPTYKEVTGYSNKTYLSSRYLQCAKDQAILMLKSAFSNGSEKPSVKHVCMKLDERFIKLIFNDSSFDYWLKLRIPWTEEWCWIPIKSYEHVKRYEEWNMLKSFELIKKNDVWYLKAIYSKDVEMMELEPKGIDIGYRKLLCFSDGEKFGENFREMTNMIDRKRQGSKRWKASKRFLKTEIDRILKYAINGNFSPVLEDLKKLKYNKKGVWRRETNRKFNNWIYSYVLRRIKELCEVAGVQYHVVPPYYTSRTCPSCKFEDKDNRKGDIFSCKCGFSGDADHVGAINILNRFQGTF